MSVERGLSSEKLKDEKLIKVAGATGAAALMVVAPTLALLALLGGVYYVSRKKKGK